MTTSRSWYEIRNLAGETEVLIYEEIGIFGVSAKDFADELKAKHVEGNRLVVRINSPGGSVFDGLAIANIIKGHSPSAVQIDGLAASIASYVAVSGEHVSIANNGFMMIHDPAGFTVGDSDDHRKTADTLDKIRDTIAQAYADKSGKSTEEIKASMSGESWFDAKEALAFGLVDEIHDAAELAANAGALPRHDFKNFAPSWRGDEGDVAVGAAQNNKEGAMTEPKKAAAASDSSLAASHEEIRAACPGCDSEFILAQLDAKATKEQAATAWMAKQGEAIEAEKAKTAEATARAEKAEAAALEGKGEPEGGPGITNGGTDGGKSGASSGGSGPISEWDDAISAEMSKGRTKPEAIRAVVTGNPELYRNWLSAYNDEHKSSRQAAKSLRRAS